MEKYKKLEEVEKRIERWMTGGLEWLFETKREHDVWMKTDMKKLIEIKLRINESEY